MGFTPSRIGEAWSDESAHLFSGPAEVDDTFTGLRQRNLPEADRSVLSGGDALCKALVSATRRLDTNRGGAPVIGETDMASFQELVT